MAVDGNGSTGMVSRISYGGNWRQFFDTTGSYLGKGTYLLIIQQNSMLLLGDSEMGHRRPHSIKAPPPGS